jgi:hypothetical protein
MSQSEFKKFRKCLIFSYIIIAMEIGDEVNNFSPIVSKLNVNVIWVTDIWFPNVTTMTTLELHLKHFELQFIERS